MQRGLAKRRVGSWMAVLALLWAALAPTLSHAVQPPGDELGFAICSATAPRATDPGNGATPEPPAPDSLAGNLEHCPYCTLQLVASAPLPLPIEVALLPLRFAAPLPDLPGTFAPAARLHASPRGPPRST